MNRTLPFTAVGLLMACTACSNSNLAPLDASSAWIRLAPPGATAMAGYLTLHNNTEAPLTCASASGPDFRAIEIHRTVIEDGVSRMLRDQQLEVPAGGTGALEPGSYHLMLFGGKKDYAVGDTTEITVVCGGERVTTTFEVRTEAP